MQLIGRSIVKLVGREEGKLIPRKLINIKVYHKVVCKLSLYS